MSTMTINGRVEPLPDDPDALLIDVVRDALNLTGTKLACGAGVCDTTAHSCVDCLDSSTCGDQVCDSSSHTCRGCMNDGECAGGFCAPSTMTCQSTMPARR